MGIDSITKLFNPYDRKARLFPALLTLVPALTVLVSVYNVGLKLDQSLVALVAWFGVFYLMTTAAREYGKRLEEKLFEKWGGKPTTQLLRHGNQIIDPNTKGRYHLFLEKHLGISFPSPEAEAADLVTADSAYQAGAHWLLGKTRDTKKFGLLFQELTAYGFRRNCLGVRPFGIFISIGAFFWILVASGALTLSDTAPFVLSKLSHGQIGALLVCLAMLGVWLFFISERTVRTAAFSYADFLLRACDSLPKKK